MAGSATRALLAGADVNVAAVVSSAGRGELISAAAPQLAFAAANAALALWVVARAAT